MRRRRRVLSLAALILLAAPIASAQDTGSKTQESTQKSQINVNWLYGSYVPKEVPLTPLNGKMRWKLYLRATYTTPGIYVKTLLFATRDQVHETYPEWGDGFDGYMKRLGSRQAEFIIQNSTIALGDGLLGWEPRYDRCRCTGVWPRSRHAMIRNFVTYNSTEKSLRPQLMPYLGAFVGRITTTTWTPGNNQWQIKGYQAVITQVPVGMGINWLSEFAPELFGWIRKGKDK
ncbi:MAG TPA: hypothetical protein VKB47_04635 [Terracidiphilus sp.]|nr:hypothetical protein [Terracidiphilus sp.]